MWILALILFIAFGFSYYFKLKYAWVIGLLNAVVLQILIFIFWEEAKFGTIPNILLLTVSIVLFGYYNFQNLVHRETIQLINKNIKTEKRTINESDIICLPEPVKKWLKQSGAIGRPYINYGKVTQIAKMQMKPEQDNWLTANATQYTTIDNPAFIWYVDVKMNSILSFQGRDKYDEGKGEMLIKLNSTWRLENKDWTWLKLEIIDIKYNNNVVL